MPSGGSSDGGVSLRVATRSGVSARDDARARSRHESATAKGTGRGTRKLLKRSVCTTRTVTMCTIRCTASSCTMSVHACVFVPACACSAWNSTGGRCGPAAAGRAGLFDRKEHSFRVFPSQNACKCTDRLGGGQRFRGNDSDVILEVEEAEVELVDCRAASGRLRYMISYMIS